jgi:murein DD-endopeptidase MepM/ murein hydrolase activator NlpD
MDDLELSPLAALADLPGAALRLLVPLATLGVLGVIVLLGAVALDPLAAWRLAERPTAPAVAPSVDEAGGSPVAAGGHDWVIAFGFAQPYGAAQFSPSLPIHRGVDLQVRGAPRGGHGLAYTPFVPGVVVTLTWDPHGGNGVILRDARGLYHRYFHNLRILVQQGQYVDRSTPLALLGDTGSPGFSHVHYEVSRRLNGDPVTELIDPRPFMRGGG